MNVFILEDDPNRVLEFRARFFVEGFDEKLIGLFDVTPYVPEARRLLFHNKYDLILLDHDLSEERNGKYVELPENGYDLVKWLLENPEIARSHGNYIIHSLNTPGREKMTAGLKSLGLSCVEAPFFWLSNIFWKHVRR